MEKLSPATPQLETSIAWQKKYSSPSESRSRSIYIPHSSVCKDFPWQQKTAFSPTLYKQTKSYTTTIATNGDPADIYYPLAKLNKCPVEFSIALWMQRALVDRADYANFAYRVASYGFIVVVPDRKRTLSAPTG